MTCAKNEMHPLDLLYRSCQAYPGGIEALAARLGVNKGTLYNKLRQACETHRVGYAEEISELLFCLEEANVAGWADTLSAFAWRHNHLVVQIPRTIGVTSADLAEAVCAAVKEQGEAIAEIGKALANDQQIDSREMVRIEKEMAEAMAALANLLELSRRMHLEAKAKGLVR